MDILEKRKLKIARKTLEMTPVMVDVMGGMSRREAEDIIKKYQRKEEVKNANKRNQYKNSC